MIDDWRKKIDDWQIKVVDISRLTVMSHEAKEEVASSTLIDSRLTHVSILQEQEL